MRNSVTWNLMMESHTERRKVVKTPLLIAVITIVHVIAIGSVFFMQGCGTPPAARVEPPPAPVMPPRDMPDDRVVIKAPQPVFPAPVAAPRAAAPADDDANVYVVKKGDMLSKIAVRHGVSAREIAELNNLKNMNDIRAGQKLLLPAYARSEKAAAKPAPKPAAGTLSGDTYVVAAGDSLSKIAARFGVKTADLAAANQISNPNSIRIGQKLVIPKGGTASSAAPKPAPVTVAPIEEVPEPQPEIPVEEEIPAPAPVKVSEPVASSAAPAGDLFTHTVATGDTLESVARLFAVLKKDLAAANGLSEDAVLSAGQKLVIPFSSSAMAP